jgi:hypothetical protein
VKRLMVLVVCCVALLCPVGTADARTRTKFVRPSLGVSTLTCSYNTPCTLSWRLVDAKGRKLGKRWVKLYRDGALTGSYKTNAKGVITRKVSYRGSANWRFVFSGDKKYRSCRTAVQTTTNTSVMWSSQLGSATGAGTWSLTQTVGLGKGRIYQFLLSQPASWSIVSTNSPTATPLAQDSSGSQTVFTFRAPDKAMYWLRLGWNSSADQRMGTYVW